MPMAIDPSFDYICFSNEINEARSGVWDIRPIPYSCDDNTRLSRFVKILPHKVLPEYDVSVWMDANIIIKDSSFYSAIDRKLSSGCLVAQVPHLVRNCVYEDLKRCYMDLRVGFMDALRQYRHLKKERFPVHFGLMENNIIFRRHNDPVVQKISDRWWGEYSSFSNRDQISLMPVYREFGYYPETLFGEGVNARNASCLEFIRHPLSAKADGTWLFSGLVMKARWTFHRIVASVFLD